MPCFNDRHGIRAAQLLGARTPTTVLLHMIEEAVMNATLRVARSAATNLASEGIYGCWLFHTQLLCVDGITLFTESGLDQVSRVYSERGHPTRPRWSPCDSPHHLYLSNEFDHASHLFLSLDQPCRRSADVVLEVERICLRVLQQLRAASLFPSQVVLTLAEGDQSTEQRYAYAELFSEPEALEKFRTDSQPINWQHVEHWRSQIPRFQNEN